MKTSESEAGVREFSHLLSGCDAGPSVASPPPLGVARVGFLRYPEEKNFLRLAREDESFLFVWNDTPGFPKSHFPLSGHRRSVAGASVELKSEPVSSFLSTLQPGPVQHPASRVHQSIACGVPMAVGQLGECQEAKREP